MMLLEVKGVLLIETYIVCIINLITCTYMIIMILYCEIGFSQQFM